MLISTPNFEKCEMFAHKIDDYVCLLLKTTCSIKRKKRDVSLPSNFGYQLQKTNVSESEYY